MAKSIENKIAVKRALSAKCLRLANVAGSLPKQTKWLYDARRYRHQADAIARKFGLPTSLELESANKPSAK